MERELYVIPLTFLLGRTQHPIMYPGTLSRGWNQPIFLRPEKTTHQTSIATPVDRRVDLSLEAFVRLQEVE